MRTGIDVTGILEELIPAVPDGLAGKVRSIGAEQVCRALVDELLSRCVPPARGGAEIHLKITSGGRSIDYVVSSGDGIVTAGAGVPRSPWARIEFGVESLAMALFGRTGAAAARGWRHEALQIPAPDTPPEKVRELMKIQDSAIQANNALLAALGPHRASLTEFACRFGTDKWGSVHWYTPHYERHFTALADEQVRLLEIGIGGYHDPESGGASLRMWQQYFRRGIIYGLDIYKKQIGVPRIRTIQGDQGDAIFLRNMAETVGPFDIIVDDGSHLNQDVLTSFTTLFPYLKDGGIYAIEDIQTAYWPGWGGNPPGATDDSSSIGCMKRLIDGLNHREFDRGELSYLDENVQELHFYHNLVFVVKGPNNECGAPLSVRGIPPAYVAPNRVSA